MPGQWIDDDYTNALLERFGGDRVEKEENDWLRALGDINHRVLLTPYG
jgi:hypothetical protein